MKRRDLVRLAGGATCGLVAAGFPAARFPGPANGHPTQEARRGFLAPRRSPFFTDVGGGRIRCDLCPHGCRLAPGERGRCRVRENRQGQGYTLVHGNPCVVQLEPVERKPFFHVIPGSRSLSVATAGCNLECGFCEVWDTALVSPEDVYAFDLPPEAIVATAQRSGARSVAYTLGEPVAYFEYMAAIGAHAREAGLLSLMHSAGFINAEPLERLCRVLDAANIDLKSFDPAFYRRVCGGELGPVLETLTTLRDAGVHVEITNIVIPGLNDDAKRIRDMCAWVVAEMGEDTPLHFSRFYPLYRLANLPPTPVSTLDRARDAARDAGLRHVYIAKVPGHEGENTVCAGCGARVIHRIGFMIEANELEGGRCRFCQAPVAGIWA
jgi:pyruvate formate lyase activating enzyme